MWHHVIPDRAQDKMRVRGSQFWFYNLSNQLHSITPLHANMACTTMLEALCYSIISAFGRLLSVYQTQCSCASGCLVLVCSFPGLKESQYWWVLWDAAPEYVLLHQQYIRQHERESDGWADPVSEKDCSFVDGEHEPVFSSLFIMKKSCLVILFLSPTMAILSHNHLDVT